MDTFYHLYDSADFCQTVRPFLESLSKEECVEILNEYFPSPRFYLPLTKAVRHRNRNDIIALFIQYGADILRSNDYEFSALEEAVLLGKLDTCILMAELVSDSMHDVPDEKKAKLFSPIIRGENDTEQYNNNFFLDIEYSILNLCDGENEKRKRLDNFLECMKKVVIPLFPWVQDNIVIFLNNNKSYHLYLNLCELLDTRHFFLLDPCKSFNNFKTIKREKALTNIAFIFSNHLADLPFEICKKISTHFL